MMARNLSCLIQCLVSDGHSNAAADWRWHGYIRVLKLERIEYIMFEEGKGVNIEFEYFEKIGGLECTLCLVVCATNVLIHFTSAYHKTLECLEMTRRGQGANRRGNKGSIMVWGKERKSHLRGTRSGQSHVRGEGEA